MRTRDLKIVKIDYDKDDELEIQKLVELMAPSIEILQNLLYPYHPVHLFVFLDSLPNNQITSKQIILGKKIKDILEVILKANINSCYDELASTFANLIFNDQLKVSEKEWIEYLSKEILNPEDDLTQLSNHARNQLQAIYLLQKYSQNLMDYLKTTRRKPEDLLFSSYHFMKEQYGKTRDTLKTPEDILVYVWQNVKYGWKNQEGKILDHVNSKWFHEYIVPSEEEVLKRHYGCCVDMARVSAYLLKERKYPSIVRLTKYYTYFHAYTLYEEEKEWYRMDAESKLNPGIIKVGTPEDDERLIFLENGDFKNTEVYNLPPKIDHKDIKEVYLEVEKKRSLSQYKKLANDC